MTAQLPWRTVVDVLASSPRVGPTLPPWVWNVVYAWLPGVEPVGSPTALLLYPTVLYLAVGVVAAGGVRWWRRRRARRTDLSDVVEPPEPEHRRPGGRRPHGRRSHRPEWGYRRAEPSPGNVAAPGDGAESTPDSAPPTDDPAATGSTATESEDAVAADDDTPDEEDAAGDVSDDTAIGSDTPPSSAAAEDATASEAVQTEDTDPDEDPAQMEDATEAGDEAPADADTGGVLSRVLGRATPTTPSSEDPTRDAAPPDDDPSRSTREAARGSSTVDPSPESPPAPPEELAPELADDAGDQRAGDARAGDTPPEAVGEPPTSADAIAEVHQRLAAADAIEWDLREPKVGEQYTKTLYVAGFPDYPKDGFLHELFEVTDAEFDATMYFTPRNQNRTRERLKRRADDLKADAKLEDGTGSQYLAAEGVKMAAAHDAMERGVRAFTTSAYFTVRGDTPADLRANEAVVRRVLTNDSQADLDVRTTQGKQDVLLQSASPIGPDTARRQSPDRYSHIQLSGGIGAVLSSFQDPSMMEAGGIELGRHKALQTPVVVDPFKRENGYSKLKIADQGGGKSHSSKMEYIRMISQRDDCIGIVLEPMGNWTGVAEATDAEHIVIGGDKQINPLEVQAIDEAARRRMKAGETPLKNKKDGAIGWLRNYFELRGLGDQLSDRIVTLENAVEDAYANRGFQEGEYETFANDSPTIRDDVIPQLQAREDTPGEYAETSQEESTIQEDAEWLRRNLRPFVDGRFAALGGRGEVDLGRSENIYLDLGQEEGREISDQAALTMQLLIDLVYQRATRTPQKVVFPIDEFHYITESAVNLGFLETLLRHHRHHEISPWFITQTVDEFLDNEIADRILKLTTMTQFHHIDTFGEEQAAPFDLSPTMQRFVRNAAPGSPELGYSDALIGIDGEWRRMEVVSLPDEARVIEYDPTRHEPEALPGRGQREYDPTPAGGEAVAANGVGTTPPPDAADSDRGWVFDWGGRS